MKSFTTSLWDNEELIKIFGKIDPDLHTRTTILLSYWNGFEYTAEINSKVHAYAFIKKKKLREDKAQIRGKTIGFSDKVYLAEFLLKSKNV